MPRQLRLLACSAVWCEAWYEVLLLLMFLLLLMLLLLLMFLLLLTQPCVRAALCARTPAPAHALAQHLQRSSAARCG